MKGRIMKIMKKSSAGFTLIEAIASLVVMCIVGVAAALGLVQGIKLYVTTRTSSETVQQAQYALNRLSLEFMNMNAVSQLVLILLLLSLTKLTEPQGLHTHLRLTALRLI